MASMSLPPPSHSSLGLIIKSHLLTRNRPPPLDLSLKGQTALITGGNSGLGLATAKVLLQHGLSRLVITVRSVEKGREVAEALRARYQASGAEILVWELDMLSYDSIQQLARRCQTDLPPLEGRDGSATTSGCGLDIAILNAGVAQAEFKLNPSTGHEVMMQTNYLSTALLALLLLPVLKGGNSGGDGAQEKTVQRKSGRLTIVASSSALTTAFTNRDANPLLPSFNNPKRWDAESGFEKYAATKTLVLILLAKLGEQKLADEQGNSVIVNAVEPGLVTGSNLFRHQKFGMSKIVLTLMGMMGGRSPEQGAWMYTYAAAVADETSHGALLMNWNTYQLHPFMYTPEGKKVTDGLWEETLKELEFAGVRDILESMGREA